MNIATKLLLISLFLQNASSITFAQKILWRYELPADVSNSPGEFWLDEDGTGYFNIIKENPQIPRQYDQIHSLLMLDKYGQFKGSTYINNCARYALLSPFGKNRLLNSGTNCNGNNDTASTDSRVFDYAGNLLLKGKGFSYDYFSRVKTPGGYTFFNNGNWNVNFTQLNITVIDTLFNISNTIVPLASIGKPNLGIINNRRDPFLMKNGIWAIPFNYGKSDGQGITIDHGTVIGVKGSQIMWQYPDTLSNYALDQFAATRDMMCLFMLKGRSKLIVMLDQDGHEIKHFYVDVTDIVVDMVLTTQHIIIMDRVGINWFNHDGVLISKIALQNQRFGHYEALKLDNQDNVYVATREKGTTVITKIGVDDPEEEETPAVKTASQTTLAISYAKFDSIAEQTLSVSVFPNPASIYINFVLQEDYKIEAPLLIQVFSGTGKFIEEKRLEGNKYELDLSAYLPGTYFYKIIQKKENRPAFVSGKFIKVGN